MRDKHIKGEKVPSPLHCVQYIDMIKNSKGLI